MKQKTLILCLPYIIVGLLCTNLGEAWRLAEGINASEKLQDVFQSGTLQTAFQNLLPSLYPSDLIVGIVCGAALRLAVYMKGKNAKKFRQNEEYGSARWGTHADIEPFEDPDFENNVILSQTERLTMSSRPPVPKYSRNKNILVVGGSGSGKTRFWIKPNLMQMHSSYVVTDPKGTLVVETGKVTGGLQFVLATAGFLTLPAVGVIGVGAHQILVIEFSRIEVVTCQPQILDPAGFVVDTGHDLKVVSLFPAMLIGGIQVIHLINIGVYTFCKDVVETILVVFHLDYARIL